MLKLKALAGRSPVRTWAMGLALVIGSASSPTAWAEASAIAYGSDNSWAWATRASQSEANETALRLCNESTSKKDCALDTTKAVVRAEGGGQIGFGRSSRSLADARSKALDSCGNTQCKVVFEVSKPGFYSLFKSVPDEQNNVDFYLAYQYSDSDRADKDAQQGCEKLTGRECKIAWSGAIAGQYKKAVETPRKAAPVASERNCRPNTAQLRCSSQCTNGSCIVTYENGCKMRVEVQPRFDPFSNQWTYPSPSC